jgi:hypothetical protein
MIVTVLIIGGLTAAESLAVTRFSVDNPSKTMPAALNLMDIWFYNPDHNKTVPDIDLEWIAVVFRSSAIGSASLGSAETEQSPIKDLAKDILDQREDLIDYYYDKNLADDACFFKLRPDMTIDAMASLLTRLNEHEAVSYAHPALRIQGRTFAFFNAFTLLWKTGVIEEEKAAVLNQVPVLFDEKDQVYRVDVCQKPFFQVLNLLAGDIRVAKADPYLVEIHVSIQGKLILGIAGGNIGDRIPFLLRIEFSPRVAIDPSSLATINLRPENIQKELFDIIFEPYDYTKAVLASPILITGQIRFYAPGDFVIPPVQIKYHCPECSGLQDRSFQTEPVPARISSLVPSAQQDSNLIVPQEPPKLDLPIAASHRAFFLNLLIAIVCLVMLIACAMWRLFRGLALSREKERLQQERKEETLEKQLRLLLNTAPGDNPWTFFSKISVLFREYLISRYRISPAPAGGSGTVFWETIGHQLPENVGSKTKPILERMDRAASLELLENADMETIRQSMVEVLDLSTTQPFNG